MGPWQEPSLQSWQSSLSTKTNPRSHPTSWYAHCICWLE
jgi:hypothetical protein